MEGTGMNGKTLVLGGWACPPALLRPLFGTDCEYVDINLLSQNIIESGCLVSNWKERVMDTLGQKAKDVDYLAGWSTGAIMALGLIPRICPRKTILLSATPSFCRRQHYRFGMPEKMVRVMIRGLTSDREKTLARFFQNCALPRPFPETSGYTTRQLSDGLTLLCQLLYSPEELKAIHDPIMILHGKDDRIVPCKAGQTLAEILHAPFHRVEGGHGFFLTSAEEVQTRISAFQA